jgi:hypothetical protein
MNVMVARRLSLSIVVVLCGLTCAFGAGLAPSVARATEFGESGENSGQFNGPFGVALDHTTGDVYVPDRNNHRIDKFDGSGDFLLAWGWDVNSLAPSQELQTCTPACQAGTGGPGAGQFAGEGPQGVAVDNNDPLTDTSAGDVYVVDWEGFRVEKFTASGEFLLMFGGGVNEAGGDVCLAGEKCKDGTNGGADGQFEWAYGSDGVIAVGPEGRVYVGDQARVEVFEPSGVWRENISLAGLSSTGKVTALAVDSAGDVFVTDEEVAGVREFEPSGVEKPTQYDAGSTTIEAVTLDAAGDVFVADSNGGFHVLKYDSAGKELDSFGLKTATSTRGVAFSDALGELYVSNASESNVWILPVPGPGPWVEPGSESSIPGLRGTATLEATVNPEGNETTYRFEYGSSASYGSSTAAVSIGSSFEGQLATAHLTGLTPGATYHYRVVATDSQNHTVSGPDQTVTPEPPALLEGPWSADVASTSATLSARIDPLGASTEYRLEYGTSASYEHVVTGNVGEGMSYVPISVHLQELETGKTYHYRVVTHNEVGTVESTDHSFTTQSAGGELALPDNRAWELVSPPNKKGALIEPFAGQSGYIQAASDGSGIVYVSVGPAVGENPVGKAIFSHVLSKRSTDGWTSKI